MEILSGAVGSFWLACHPVLGETNYNFAIDTLIVSLESKILNDSGLAEHPCITSHFQVVSSLPHGNSALENGFSTNT